MSKIDDKIDLTILPEEAKKELYDFYLFLLTKYSNKNSHNNNEDDFIKNLIPRKLKNVILTDRENYYAR
ncbi:MAG TPA: hypothetical protein PLE45_06110 [Spirochaetota bacterium]|nr:hypothetical protein [Spirochaetota bacterium]HOL57594.1 hypothetical protein [Spirochaetota bacterium]HPP04526.1 hypothetical protein [Spirochaetota bacterium]